MTARMHPRTLPRMLMIAGTLAGSSAAAVAQDAAAPQPRAPQAAAPVQPAEQFANVDALLDALERTGQNIVSLTADLKYDKTSDLEAQRQIRLGKLSYVSGLARAGAANVEPAANGDAPLAQPDAADGGQKFAIRFKEQWLDRTRRDEEMTYIFDGEWLVEKLPEQQPKLFIKRQVVQPGQKFNPLRIGEGPFPIPIGQRKADILQRYTAELLPAAAGLDAPDGADAIERRDAEQAKAAAAGSVQLRLVPRPERAEDDDFSEIRLWYRASKDGVLLPRMARTQSKAGDTTAVLLINTEVQLAGGPENPAAAVPPEVLDVRTPRPEEGWEVVIQPWRGHEGPAGERRPLQGDQPGGRPGGG